MAIYLSSKKKSFASEGLVTFCACNVCELGGFEMLLMLAESSIE
jgi:hypothetical protein